MPYQRDIGDFDDRASGYEAGWRGQLHRQIVARTVGLALSVAPFPSHVLDVGCGTGLLLRELAVALPAAIELQGIDAAPRMVDVAARATAGDPRIAVRQAYAESLPFAAAAFDLLVSTTSFDHWRDQRQGARECARVLAPGGRLVLCDQFHWVMAVTLPFGHRRQARTPRALQRLLADAGFRDLALHPIYAGIIQAATATR